MVSITFCAMLRHGKPSYPWPRYGVGLPVVHSRRRHRLSRIGDFWVDVANRSYLRPYHNASAAKITVSEFPDTVPFGSTVHRTRPAKFRIFYQRCSVYSKSTDNIGTFVQGHKFCDECAYCTRP